MSAWYEALMRDTCTAIAAAWPDVDQAIRPEQLGRRNFLQEIERGSLRLPLALVRVRRLRAAPEYAGNHVALRATVVVYRVERYEGSGADQTQDALGWCAALLERLAGDTWSFNLEVDRVEMDASEETEDAARSLLGQSLQMVAASLTFTCIVGFAVQDVAQDSEGFDFSSTLLDFSSTGWNWADA